MEKSFLEEIAMHDENLLEKYLAEKPLSEDEIKKAIRDGCIKNVFIPTLWALLLRIKEFNVYLMQLTIFCHHQ